MRFAWYLLRDGKVVEKHFYMPEPHHTFTLPGPGRYQVRCFMQDERKRRHSLFSPVVEVADDV